jgi:DNA (cytosine-5)-methyltransferase 1
LQIDNILIENVKEFKTWGPLGTNGIPLKSRKGETFKAFLEALRSLGYKVEYRVLCAADYGDPTTRERLFVIARRGKRKILWPEPTHSKDGERTLFGKMKRWRAAKEIIDWNLPGTSIFARKRPLSPNTINRIVAGLRKFCGKEIEPFLVMLYKSNDARSIKRPMPTVTAQGGHIGLAQPFLIRYNGNHKGKKDGEQRVESVKKPLSTIDCSNRLGLAQPFLVQFNNNSQAQDVEQPLPTVMTKDKLGLCRPFLVKYHGTGRPASIDNPMPTVTTKDRCGVVQPFMLGQQSCAAPRSTKKPVPTIAAAGAISLVQPFIVGWSQTGGNGKCVRSIKDPLPTICTKQEHGIVEPFIVPFFGERKGQTPRCHSVKDPLPTVTGHGAGGLVEPFILPTNHGKDTRTHSINKPMPTATTVDAWGLAMPVINGQALDIRFRMLQPRELARAMSFGDDYKFTGNREAIVKQIGNAVPVMTAKRLCEALLQ